MFRRYSDVDGSNQSSMANANQGTQIRTPGFTSVKQFNFGGSEGDQLRQLVDDDSDYSDDDISSMHSEAFQFG